MWTGRTPRPLPLIYLVPTMKPFRKIKAKDKKREKKKNTGQALAVDKPFKEGQATTTCKCGLQAPRGFLLGNLFKSLR